MAVFGVPRTPHSQGKLNIILRNAMRMEGILRFEAAFRKRVAYPRSDKPYYNNWHHGDS